MHPNRSAILGVLLTLPFILLNAIVVSKFEPFYSLIRPGLHTSPTESWLLMAALLLLPVAFFITIRPMLDGTRRLYPINIILGAFILLGTIFLWSGLSEDIFMCDVFHIPNCD